MKILKDYIPAYQRVMAIRFNGRKLKGLSRILFNHVERKNI